MPIYEYQCGRCAHRFEALRGMNAAPLTTCPACGEDALTKLISAAAFRLKGSGWYETDFKNPKPKPNGETGETKSGDAPKSKDGESKDAKKPKDAEKPAAGASSAGDSSAKSAG